MEHESFENEAIAKVMNDNFVNIKVDREERPDLDQIYMTAVQRMTRHGGWPMSMFLTPDLKPFYGGTYFPPADRHGLPSFRRVLTQIAEVWREQHGAVLEQADQITSDLQTLGRLEPAEGELDARLLEN